MADAATQLLERLAEMVADRVVERLDSKRPGYTRVPSAQSYLTTKEAAERLGVTVKSLESLRARGKGPPFVRIGKSVRYRLEDLP